MKAAVLHGAKDIRTETVNFPGAIELLQSGKVTTRPLVTHSFPLDQAQESFRTQLQDRQAIKVMIKP